MQPGDNLVLQPGKYPGGIWLKGLYGRPDAPITIRGQGPQTVLVGREGTNTVDLSDCQWLVLRDLTFDGQGKEVDAIKAGKETARGCHHITIENNTIIVYGNVRLTAAEAAEVIVAPVPQLGKLDVQPRRPIPATVPVEIRGLLQRDVDYDRDFWGNVRDRFDQVGPCQPSSQARAIKAQRRLLIAPAVKTPPDIPRSSTIRVPVAGCYVYGVPSISSTTTDAIGSGAWQGNAASTPPACDAIFNDLRVASAKR